ncbi:hypothetical protein [Massilicoli timonensis]|uniref:hypothetical protein n=1 Tax=Massilicoli timonensis TaxID=2015901 RepID=UPI000C84DF69|nr:hypothetical protein [Massilicoli timonensis]
MSFIIGICYDDQAILATDRRVTERSEIIDENYKKLGVINLISGLTYVGYGGNKDLANSIMRLLKNVNPFHLGAIENCIKQVKPLLDKILSSQNIKGISNKFIYKNNLLICLLSYQFRL